MKNLLRNALLGSTLVLCATGTASANQLLVFVTAGQIQSAVSGSTFSGNCSAGLTDCGVYGVGFISATGGATATSGAANSSPVPTGSAKWIGASISGYNGYEAGGSTATYGSNTQEQFITANTHTVGPASCPSAATPGCYTAHLPSVTVAMPGLAAMNSSTQIGFLLTFASEVASGTTINMSLQLLAAQLLPSGADNLGPALQGTKGMAGNVTVSGLTLVALPEPASIALGLSGLGAIAVMGWRRRRQKRDDTQ